MRSLFALFALLLAPLSHAQMIGGDVVVTDALIGAAASGVNADITTLSALTTIKTVAVTQTSSMTNTSAGGIGVGATAATQASITSAGQLLLPAYSTITFNGPIALSTAATPALTATPAISVNAAGQVRFGVPISSFMVSGALSGTFANTTLVTCVSGSTVSLTLPAGTSGNVQAQFHGAIANGNLAANISVGLIVDGAFIDGETTTKGLTSTQQAVATDNENFSFSELITGLAAGSHTFCLAALVSAGTATIDSTNSVAKLQVNVLP